jgi:hypothetical protein
MLMRLGKFVKTPSEVKRYSVEYSDWLDTGEYLQSVVFGVPTAPGDPLVAIANTIESSATRLTFFISGGAAGASYEVSVKTTTTGGQVKEDTILFTVREP